MAVKALYISVCDQTVSVCRTARKGKAVHIYDSFVFPTPEDCVSDGVILNPALLGSELRKQLAQHGIGKTKNAVFSLLSNKIAVREIKLPPMKKKLISSAITTNSEDYFPIDLKSYHVTYTILESATTQKPYNRILVLAVPVSIIEGYFLLAEKAGLTVKAIDSSGNSQYQAMKQLEMKGVSVFVDAGCSSSIVTFISEGKLLLQRTFAFGTIDLLSHYMSLSGRAKEDFLSVINETDITHPDFAADKLLTLTDVQSDLERLVGGVMRSIDYFNSNQSGAGVSRIVLLGLTRHIVGLRELIADSTGLETLYLDTVPEFAQFTGNYPEASAFVSCIGCSLEPLNLIPKKLLPTKGLSTESDESSIMPGVIICAVIVAAAILVSASAWLKYASTLSDLTNVQNEIANLQSAQETYDTYLLYQEGETAITAFSLGTRSMNAQLVGFFEELEEKMPSSILFLSAACSSEGVSLSVTVGSYTEAAAVITALRSFESLQKVEVSDLAREEDETGAGRVSFSVSCFYGINPYTNDLNPYNEFIFASDETSDTAAAQPEEAGQ